jgi:class 3 adenylate cyclase
MSDLEPSALPEVASEAIVLADLVESTAVSNRFGWYAVGRSLLRDLRALIARTATPRGLACLKSTGDGYLMTFADPESAEVAAVQAVEWAFELLAALGIRNGQVPEQRRITLRLAVHFGEVDVLQHDREGPHVSYAFRLEAVSRASLATALNPIPPDDLPLADYVLCSEEVAEILTRRAEHRRTLRIGLLKLKGFPGWREVFLVLPNGSGPPGPEPHRS